MTWVMVTEEAQPGAEIGLARGHGANGAGEVDEGVVFQHITGCAGLATSPMMARVHTKARFSVSSC